MPSIRSSLIASGFVYLCVSCLLSEEAGAQAPAPPATKTAAAKPKRAAKPVPAPEAKPAPAPEAKPAAEGKPAAETTKPVLESSEPVRADGQPRTDGDAADEKAPSDAVVLEAKQRFDRGFELYDEGEYPLALIEFSRAYELVPNYRVLYNIGQVCIQLGQYANARRALEEYRQKGGEELSRERREAIAKDLEMLGNRTAFLLITSNVEGAEVSVDDVSMGKTPLAPALLVDAGVHRVSLRHVGYQPKSARVTLAGGDEHTLALDLEPQPEVKPTFVVRERADAGNSQTLMIVGWATTGALVAGAIVTGVMGVGEADELEQLKGADPRDYEDLAGRLEDTKSNASTLLLTSDILSGAALVVGGLSLWITIDPLESGTPPADDAPGPKPAKGVQVGYQDSQLQLRASF